MSADTIFMGFLVLAAILDYWIQAEKDAMHEIDQRSRRNYGRRVYG